MKFTVPLPEGVYHNDKFYPINTDFKTWIKIDELMNSSIVNETEKTATILSLAYKSSFPDNIDSALAGILDFYTMYSPEAKVGFKKVYSFEKDASFIFSAFFTQYGIDLFETDMHWWKFRALFDAIDENTLFGKIVRYRAVNLEDIKDKSKKRFIRKMKQIYSLGQQENIAEALFAL